MSIFGKSIWLASSLTLVSASAHAAAYKFDKTSGTVTWVGGKQFIDSKHNGTVELKEGSLDLKAKGAEKGRFVIDLNTIKNSDVEDLKYRAKLEDHLKSADFFDVAKHKDAVVVIKDLAADSKEKGKYLVKADVTIRGQTNEVSFPASIKEEKGKVVLNGKLDLDRTKWGIGYGSPASFNITDLSKVVEDKIKDVKDKVIKNEFTVEIKLEGKA